MREKNVLANENKVERDLVAKKTPGNNIQIERKNAKLKQIISGVSSKNSIQIPKMDQKDTDRKQPVIEHLPPYNGSSRYHQEYMTEHMLKI